MRVTSKLRDVIYIQYIMTRKIQVSRKLRVGANLIPSFRGASAIHEWMPNENRTDDFALTIIDVIIHCSLSQSLTRAELTCDH